MAERLTYDEMVERYPGKWVFVKNPEKRGPDVVSGEVICVCSDDEYTAKFIEIRHSGINFDKFRTTHDFYGGFIYAENLETTIE